MGSIATGQIFNLDNMILCAILSDKNIQEWWTSLVDNSSIEVTISTQPADLPLTLDVEMVMRNFGISGERHINITILAIFYRCISLVFYAL